MPDPNLSERVEKALAREYRVPFRLMVGIVVVVVGFLFTYSEVAKWVQAQVRADRVAIDTRRDQESILQNKRLDEQETRIIALEHSSAGFTTGLSLLTTEVRETRAEVGRLALLIEAQGRKK